MTLTALLATIAIALIALPMATLAAMMWNAIPTSGLGDIFPDERLVKAINTPADAGTAEHPLWT